MYFSIIKYMNRRYNEFYDIYDDFSLNMATIVYEVYYSSVK